jgi:hypothetical protein
VRNRHPTHLAIDVNGVEQANCSCGKNSKAPHKSEPHSVTKKNLAIA